jgi:Disulphide bond corrector protein DsbC
MKTTAYLASACVWVVLAGGPADAQDAQTSASVVKVTAKAGKPDDQGRVEVTITLDIDEDYFLFANPAGNETFELSQTKVRLKKGEEERVKDLEVEYPQGKERVDRVIGDYRVYEGRVQIKARFTPPAGQKEPVTLQVKLTAFNDKRFACLPWAVVDLHVP